MIFDKSRGLIFFTRAILLVLISLSVLIFFISIVRAQTLSSTSFTLEGGTTAIAQSSSGGGFELSPSGDPVSGASSSSSFSSSTSPVPTTVTTSAAASSSGGGGGGGSVFPTVTDIKLAWLSESTLQVSFATNISSYADINYGIAEAELPFGLESPEKDNEHTFIINGLDETVEYDFILNLTTNREGFGSDSSHEFTVSPEDVITQAEEEPAQQGEVIVFTPETVTASFFSEIVDVFGGQQAFAQGFEESEVLEQAGQDTQDRRTRRRRNRADDSLLSETTEDESLTEQDVESGGVPSDAMVQPLDDTGTRVAVIIIIVAALLWLILIFRKKKRQRGL